MDKMSPDDDGGEGDDELRDVGEAAVHEAGQLGPGLLPEHVVSHCTVLYCTIQYCTVLYLADRVVGHRVHHQLHVEQVPAVATWSGAAEATVHGSQDFAVPN